MILDNGVYVGIILPLLEIENIKYSSGLIVALMFCMIINLCITCRRTLNTYK